MFTTEELYYIRAAFDTAIKGSKDSLAVAGVLLPILAKIESAQQSEKPEKTTGNGE